MNTNDNAHPFDHERAAIEHSRALARLLPAVLALLPLASVTAALEWCAVFLFALAKGRDEASEMHDAAERELPADVRAAVDVALVCVLGHAAVDAIGSPGDGPWGDDYLAAGLAAVQGAQETVTGLRHGERDAAGPTADVIALDVRERAEDAQRRAMVRAIVATIPQGDRAGVLGACETWAVVVRGLARAVEASAHAVILDVIETAAREVSEVFSRSDSPAAAHRAAVRALFGLWCERHPLLAVDALRGDAFARRDLAGQCDAIERDIAHVRALLAVAA